MAAPADGVLRTPDAAFEGLGRLGYAFAPHYVTLRCGLRVHYVDEGPRDAPATVLCLHGEPSWSFLYRKMVPALAAAGHRVLAPDLVGFGKSDKPSAKAAYTYAAHVAWITELLLTLDLRRVTLVAQDWGGLIGLRLLAAHPGRFDAAVVANTGLPTGEGHPSRAFLAWQAFAAAQTDMPVGSIVGGGCASWPSDEVVAAYEAPFPDARYKAGAHVFPALVPTRADDPEAAANRAAWDVLRGWRGRLHVMFSDSDPITRGAERPFLALPCCASSVVLAGGGHFLQEDVGPAFAEAIVRAMRGDGGRARL